MKYSYFVCFKYVLFKDKEVVKVGTALLLLCKPLVLISTIHISNHDKCHFKIVVETHLLKMSANFAKMCLSFRSFSVSYVCVQQFSFKDPSYISVN